MRRASCGFLTIGMVTGFLVAILHQHTGAFINALRLIF